MIPISDINPPKNNPVISRIFIFLSILVYVLIQPRNPNELFNFFYEFAAIPCEVFNNQPLSLDQYYNNECTLKSSNIVFENKNILLSLLFSNMFHANFVHILGNLWSFWIFGNNIEDKLGKIRFIIFLIFTGLASMFSHIILNAFDINPIVGASGIVSALMGAYLYLFPNAQLLVLVPFGFLFPTTIKAKFFMIFWFISQILIALQNTNISWEAHIGGFIVGYLILKIFNYRRYTI
mgnify:FL=1